MKRNASMVELKFRVINDVVTESAQTRDHRALLANRNVKTGITVAAVVWAESSVFNSCIRNRSWTRGRGRDAFDAFDAFFVYQIQCRAQVPVLHHCFQPLYLLSLARDESVSIVVEHHAERLARPPVQAHAVDFRAAEFDRNYQPRDAPGSRRDAARSQRG